MKIFLCTPPAKVELGPTLGLGYLASALEKKNHQVFFQDGNLTSLPKLIGEIQKTNPDIVGIYMNTVTRFEVISLVEQIKARKNLPVVVGGPHPTLMPGQLLRHYDCLDYVIRGEAEESLPKFLNHLEAGQRLERVLGLSFRKRKKIIHNPPAPFVKNLDSLTFPKHEMFDYRRYPVPKDVGEENLMVIPVVGSRGCPFRCTFCSSSQLTGRLYRARSTRNVLEEIRYLSKNFKVDYIYFRDDHFFLDKKRTKEFCRGMIDQGLSEKIRWRCTGRVDCVDGPTLNLMKKAGCDFIRFGVEAATKEGLKFFNKKITLPQVKKAFDFTRRASIRTGANFIIGGDHETMATIKKQRQLIKKLNPDLAGASVLTVFPGTDLFQLAKKKGIMDENIWLTKSPKIPFHNNVPLYPGPHLDHDTLIKEAAKLTFWWMHMVKKNQSFSLIWGIQTAFSYLRAGKFKELKNILLAVFKQAMS